MRRIRLAVVPGMLLVAASVALGLTEDNARFFTQSIPVKDRPEVNRKIDLARLENGRVMYRLSFDALVGKPLELSADTQIEGIRRQWAPYKPLPTPDQMGYTALGLEPGGGWDEMGFFDLYLNDIGFTYTAPAVRTFGQAGQIGTELVWQNSQARLTQTFVLREGDDKLLMSLRLDPLPGQTLERVVLRLRNTPTMGNTAYNNPATRQNVVVTALGEELPPKRVDLDPRQQSWVAYYNKDLGASPSALLFLPGEVDKGHVLLGKQEIQTVLFLAPGKREYHFALWELPQQPNGYLVAYLQENGAALGQLLAALAGKDWTQSLPTPAEDRAPLHLTAAAYTPTEEERKRGYVASPLDTFEYADANSLPGAALPGLTLTACPGQVEPASFLLYGLRDVGQVTLQSGDLTAGGGKRIPAAQVNVSVVKVWPQCTGTWCSPGADFAMTPELLVRNDLFPLKQVWTAQGPGEPGLLTGPATTRLARDSARQIFVTVSVPAQAQAGTYRGNLTVLSEDGHDEIPLTVEVLPFRLHDIDEKYLLGMYYRGMPFPDPDPQRVVTAEYIPAERFLSDLRMMRSLGINALYSIVPPGKKPGEYLDAVFPVLGQLGFRSPVVVAGWGYAYNGKFDEKTTAEHKAVIGEYLRHCSENQYLTPTFYGIDEPTAARYNGIEVTRKRAEITHQVSYGALRGTYCTAGNTLGELTDVLDYAIISTYYTPRAEMQKQRDALVARGATPLYYWQIWGEYPKGTRLNAGYFLYASGFRGFFPYVYQHFETNPYDEYEEGLHSMMLVYPSAEGPVPTLESEALRAGINDLRYLVTLSVLIEERAGHDPAGAEEMRKRLGVLLDKYGWTGSANWGRMIYGALNWPQHQKNVPNAQFDADRREVVKMIQECGG